jgi:hypothetical protein
LLALLWRPQAQPLLLQFLTLSGAALVAIGAHFDPLTSIVQAAAITLLVISYPNRAALARFSQPGSLSRPLIVLSLPATALLALDAWRTLQSQLAAPDRASIAAVILAITLSLACILAATKRPGWQALGLLTGIALIYLGLVAARLPNQAGSWGILGVALATFGGWAFVGATTWEMQLETRRAVLSANLAAPRSNYIAHDE